MPPAIIPYHTNNVWVHWMWVHNYKYVHIYHTYIWTSHVLCRLTGLTELVRCRWIVEEQEFPSVLSNTAQSDNKLVVHAWMCVVCMCTLGCHGCPQSMEIIKSSLQTVAHQIVLHMNDLWEKRHGLIDYMDVADKCSWNGLLHIVVARIGSPHLWIPHP